MIYPFKIGPFCVHFESAKEPKGWMNSCYKPFKPSVEEAPTLTVRLHFEKKTPTFKHDAPLLGEVKDQWRLYEQGKKFRLEVIEQMTFKVRDVALISSDLHEIDLYLLPALWYTNPPVFREGWHIGQVLEPIIMWWMNAYLARNDMGFLLHASAVKVNGKGFVFYGPSDAGKTTTAKFFHALDNATVLNDERILIWFDGEKYQVSGTPWHGELRVVSHLSVPIALCSFLTKANRNEFKRRNVTEIIMEMSQQAFLPLWSEELMTSFLKRMQHFIESVPNGELEFLKDPSVTEYLLDSRQFWNTRNLVSL